MQTRDSVKEMKSFREKLPAFKMKSEFLKVVQENQVQKAIYCRSWKNDSFTIIFLPDSGCF